MNIYDFYITPEEYERAAKNGISKMTLESRIRLLAWDKERAVSEPVPHRNNVKEWIQLAKDNGISKRTFEKRVYEKKWSYQEAATIPIMDEETRIKEMHNKRRRYPKYILELAESNNIPYDTFRHRVNRSKMTLEEAATKPVMSSREIGLMNKDKRKIGIDLIFIQNKTKKLGGEIYEINRNSKKSR
ncbi:MAG: hypothetical protein AB6733_10920 [Clostridiaceae bacterium]